jgi:hypothetical protein
MANNILEQWMDRLQYLFHFKGMFERVLEELTDLSFPRRIFIGIASKPNFTFALC